MSTRSAALWCALAGLGAALAVSAPAAAKPAKSAKSLPVCTPGAASKVAPRGPARLDAPNACRAGSRRVTESSVRPQRLRENTATGNGASRSGYTHLGAGTGGEWAGVSGRIAVRNTTVRRGTYDFVAARFMAKQDQGNGRMAWLEVGWAETGWSGDGRQRIYTFDTNGHSWRFYDEYALRPGDRFWLDLRTAGNGTWQAWLWWDNRWNLLSTQKLPLGRTAHIEQYVEMYVDGRKPGSLAVPQVSLDNVWLWRVPNGEGRYWREDVNTVTGDTADARRGGFCLDWATRYDTWSAGDCPSRDRR